ncbi:uncharacterized protein LOC126579107 [Anopheles aquasalis]|uniref:uncharacterized protein LOC126579107 n=1 Tax=Anopheles aquasalis TaxID=42839 RepID=UPI00215B7179|nr:uncharacterized protein LOC126579107 [Anopheles aquasalis]
MNVDIRRELKDVKLTVEYYTVFGSKVSQNPLVSRTVDFCAFLKDPARNRLVNVLYEVINRNTNLPTKCPMQPGIYYIRDIRLSTISLPGMLPESGFVMKELFVGAGPQRKPLYYIEVVGKIVRVRDL